MINPDQLHAFLEKIELGVVAVDLLRIGQYHAQQQLNSNKSKFARFRVALDMEQCLDRFYGGYFSDWACGGQWNRALQFVQLLSNAFNAAQIEVITFFDGTLRENKRLQTERNDFRQKTLSVLKHIGIIGTPPPKVWWLPPSGIRTTLRNALRIVNIQVVQTVHDHTWEIIDYFKENKLNAIIGLHPDYIIANVSRYFNSHDLRLSYKGALETKEFMAAKVFSNLKLTSDQVAIIAVLLGGYVLIEDTVLREIYKKISVEYNSDFETRIRKLADVVRDKKTTDEFITTLGLEAWETELRESIEYYQRRGAFNGKRYLGNKKKAILADNGGKKAAPMASETCETDEAAKKILETATEEEKPAEEEKSTEEKPEKEPSASTSKKSVKFVYTLPAEVIRTAAQRHQRGIMDPRIYILLIKKEILLPQVLEDEQYRDIPPVHLFYRSARQMIYAILFNLYHQQYMHSKGGPDPDSSPEIVINEWIWSPKNEFKTPEKVSATKLTWAVPTVQRLWFGMTYEDKQRRMKAFLTIMRSDTPLMLNRNYVPQHLLVLACVLRYIVSNPERNVISRVELDAFLATAFSPQLVNVDYTQAMVLPSVHLRGVYLATLFMQGVETAQLANDACGVPVPWSMTNPWLFFDGKILHLKLRMAQWVTSARELCDDQPDVMMKIERFRKAVLEDIEHLMYPPGAESLLREQFYNSSPALAALLYKSLPIPGPLKDILFENGYGAQQYQQYDKSHQLKVGGVVVGQWAANRGGAGARNGIAGAAAAAAAARYPLYRQKLPRGRAIAANPNSRAQGGAARKTTKNKNKSQKNKNKKKQAGGSSGEEQQKVVKIQTKEDELKDGSEGEESFEIEDITEEILNMKIQSEPQTNGEEQNGTATTLDGSSDLHDSVIKICDDVLKDDDPIIDEPTMVNADNDSSKESKDACGASQDEFQCDSSVSGDAAASKATAESNSKKSKKNKKGKLTKEDIVTTKTD